MIKHAAQTVTAGPTDETPDCGPVGALVAPVGEVLHPVAGHSGNGQGSPNSQRPSTGAHGDLVASDVLLSSVGRSELTWTSESYGLLRDTKVLIVDDSKLYREYLASVVAANGASRPSVAWDVPSLLAALEESVPRIILLNTATRDSVLLLRQALSINPTARVIALGMSEDDEAEIVACAEAGVAGYHLRSESLEDLLLLVRKVAAGESSCSPRVSAILLRRLTALASQRQCGTEELVLTSREAQILKMLEMGRSNREIAEELCIAVHTVKNHVHSLLTKLGVSSRAQAAARSRTIRYTEGGPRN